MKSKIIHILLLILASSICSVAQEPSINDKNNNRIPTNYVIPSFDFSKQKSRLELNIPTPSPIYLTNYDTLLYKDINISLKKDFTSTREPFTWQGNIFSKDFRKIGELAIWDNGYISGFSSSTTLPLLGSAGTAGFGFSHDFNNKLNFSGSISFNKYSIPRNVYNSYAFSGELSYKISHNISISAFGYYESTGLYNNTPRMLRNSLTNIGGYVTTMTNNQKWGIDTGVQRYYSPMQGRWVTVPIFKPYYNLNGQKLGIDFGGLIQQIFHTLSVGADKTWDIRYDNNSSFSGSKNHSSNKPNILIPRNKR